MIKLSEKKFVFTTKLNVDDELWVELREPTLIEFKKFSDDGMANLEAARKLFPSCIIDSNFENDEGEKLTGEQIWKLIEPSASLASRLINEWLESIPFRVIETGKTSD